MNRDIIEKYARLMIAEGMGLDLSDPNLSGTPARLAKMYAEEFFASVGESFENYSCFPNNGYHDLVISEGIQFVSMCSHHFLPFHGTAWFGYIPEKQIVGLSKLSRVVVHYAHRPQLQERMTQEIIENFVQHVHPRGAMLVIKASHACQTLRGARQPNAVMTTSSLTGVFVTDPTVKQEMMDAVNVHGGSQIV